MSRLFAEHVSAVVFDAGGTLVRLDYQEFAAAADARGYPLDHDTIELAEAVARQAIDADAADGAATGTDAARLQSYFRRLLSNVGIPDAILEEVATELEALHRRENLWRVAMPGAAKALRGLREQGLRTAVVSNADGRAESGLRGAGLTEHLEFVVDSTHEGVEKPNPEIFHRALRRLDLPPERAVYIGDIYSIDVVGARAAGMSAVIIDPTGTYLERELDCPIIADLCELLTPSEAKADGE